MTNKDKYLKDGVDVEELCAGIINEIADEYMGDEEIGVARLIDFFDSEYKYKPTLTEDEKVILSNALESGADAIFRNDGGIYFHTKPGTKGIFGNIFQFIKPRRRI